MLKKHALSALAFVAMMSMGSQALAGQLVYRPINPAFGGDPFNSNYLFQSANEQKAYEEPPEPRPDALENFEDTITRSILSRVSREIADAIYGESAADSGSFQVGDTFIDFVRTGEQVQITISDPNTGQETVLDLPVPEF